MQARKNCGCSTLEVAEEEAVGVEMEVVCTFRKGAHIHLIFRVVSI